MAQPYAPFGYMPPTLGGPPRQQPLTPYPIPPLPQHGPLPGMLEPTGAEREDLQREAMGLYNAATVVAPFALAGPIGAGSSRLAGLMAQYPRTATGAIAGATTVDQTTAAGPKPTDRQPAQDPQLQQLLSSDPLLRQLQTQIREQEGIANDQSRFRSVRDGARVRAADLQKEFNARLQELSAANLPFDQAYPWLAQNRIAAGFLLPLGAGYATRTAAGLADRAMTSPWRHALRQADRALERGNERAYQHYMSRAQRWEPKPDGSHWWGETGLPAIAGGTMGLELAHAPYAHNLQNAPIGSPQRQEAEAITNDPLQLGARLGLGLFGGVLGGLTGGHLPNVPFGFRPPAASPPSGPTTPLSGAPPTAGGLPPPQPPAGIQLEQATGTPPIPPAGGPSLWSRLFGGQQPVAPPQPPAPPPVARLNADQPRSPSPPEPLPPRPRSSAPRHPKGAKDDEGNPVGGRYK